MPTRTADAEWNGEIMTGAGHMRLGSGAFDGPYDFRSRMGDGAGTNPEELIGAAHAGCFSMALAAQLGGAGFKPEKIATKAKVHFNQVEGGWAIDHIELETEVAAQGLGADELQRQAATAKENCPVSKALKGVEISLVAKLI
jgi:osmotically inducible protein OsmC